MWKQLSRRSFLERSGCAFATAMLPHEMLATATTGPEHLAETPTSVDDFAAAYLQKMHAPGIVVSLASGVNVSTRAYGFDNLQAKSPLKVTQPFWIGSICKSFVGIVAMQMRDEGKLDLERPVHDMMPGLPFTEEFGKINTHHLLTHTSGLPNWLQLFSADPSQIARQAYAPGTTFAYCNLAFDMLGLLIGHLDGGSWPNSVRERIFSPLGMNESSALIEDAVEARMPTGYHYQYRDRPCVLVDPQVPVGYVTMSNAAGSITAPAGDMCKYIRMLLERGRGPGGRIVSEEGFKLFSTPHIKAPVLSKDASYGYGIGVEMIDGRTMLRHTGGATSFASSILVDLDGGVGAFASINAMQGFRPNPVTRFAVDVLYAAKSGKSSPPVLPIDDPLAIPQPEKFQGQYRAVGGSTFRVEAKGGVLTVTSPRGTTELRPLGGDAFSAADDFVMSERGQRGAPSAFALVFERERPDTKNPGAVVALGYGPEQYFGDHHSSVSTTSSLKTGERYTGMYSNDSPWTSVIRIVERNDALLLDGTDAMQSKESDRFSVAGDEGTLELTFRSFLEGRAQVLFMDGEVFRRVGPAF